MSISIGEWVKQSASVFESVSDSARLDAEILLAKTIDKDRSYLYTWPEKEISGSLITQLNAWRDRREKGEPVAHIVGEREFWSLPFYTDASTLIPRPETELLVETCLSLLGEKPKKLLDLGTGTGAIAISLAKECPDCDVVAVDLSNDAVLLAKKNADRNQVKNIQLRQSDWFQSVSGKFHFIVSNPPYIDPEDPHLGQGDVRFEPKSALVAGEHGLADIKHIAKLAPGFLHLGGCLMFEHGFDQRVSVENILQNSGFENIVCVQDYAGKDRITYGQLL